MQMQYRGFEIALSPHPAAACRQATYRIYHMGTPGGQPFKSGEVSGAFSSAEHAQLEALAHAERWIDRHLAERRAG